MGKGEKRKQAMSSYPSVKSINNASSCKGICIFSIPEKSTSFHWIHIQLRDWKLRSLKDGIHLMAVF